MTSRLPGMLCAAVVTAVALGGCSTLAAPEPGFWEQNGYNMYGDPWAEQRYW